MHDEDLRKSLGSIIREAREMRGWTRYELAKRTGLGATHIACIENGVYSIRVDVLNRICNALALSITFPRN